MNKERNSEERRGEERRGEEGRVEAGSGTSAHSEAGGCAGRAGAQG